MTNEPTNERIEILSKMIGTDPKHWPFPITRNLEVNLLDVSVGAIKFKVTVKEDWLNPLQILHGGIMITLMDDAMGIAVYTLNREDRFASINLNTDFFKSVKEGEDIFIYSKIEKAGRQVVHATAYIENEKGQLIAKSTSNLVVFSKKS